MYAPVHRRQIRIVPRYRSTYYTIEKTILILGECLSPTANMHTPDNHEDVQQKGDNTTDLIRDTMNNTCMNDPITCVITLPDLLARRDDCGDVLPIHKGHIYTPTGPASETLISQNVGTGLVSEH